MSSTSDVSPAAATTNPSVDAWFDGPLRWLHINLVGDDPIGADVDTWRQYWRDAHVDGLTVDAARLNGTFAMEALWTRFLPVYDTVQEWLADDAIGDVQHLSAAFGFRVPVMVEHRLFASSLGGGRSSMSASTRSPSPSTSSGPRQPRCTLSGRSARPESTRSSP